MITLCLCVSLIWKSYAHFQWDCNWNGQTQFQLLQQINCDKIVINLPIGLHAHFSKHLPIYVFNYTRNQIETLSASFRSGIHIDWIFHHKSSARKKNNNCNEYKYKLHGIVSREPARRLQFNPFYNFTVKSW